MFFVHKGFMDPSLAPASGQQLRQVQRVNIDSEANALRHLTL